MATNTYPDRTKSEWIVQFKENPNSVKETIEEVLGEKISSGNVDDFFEDQEVLIHALHQGLVHHELCTWYLKDFQFGIEFLLVYP